MGTKVAGGWSLLTTERRTEIEVAGEKVNIPIEVPIQARVMCGSCGKPMAWSYSEDGPGDFEIEAYCDDCMPKET